MNLKKYDIACLHAARALIDKHHHRHMVIPDIAREVGLSNTKLKDGFKKLFGVGLYTYLLQGRMGRAKKMLEETDHSIKTVAIATGYKSSSSFITAFRKEFGLTPAKYRRRA